jgi:hypothetical protein
VIWWAMSAESAFLALQEIGLNPDPPEIERLSAIAIGKAPPRGDAAREQSLRRQIFLAAWNRRILIQFRAQAAPEGRRRAASEARYGVPEQRSRPAWSGKRQHRVTVFWPRPRRPLRASGAKSSK